MITVQFSMGYDEFNERLRKIKIEYEEYHKTKLQTINELEQFLMKKLIRKKSSSARSLKGLF